MTYIHNLSLTDSLTHWSIDPSTTYPTRWLRDIFFYKKITKKSCTPFLPTNGTQATPASSAQKNCEKTTRVKPWMVFKVFQIWLLQVIGYRACFLRGMLCLSDGRAWVDIPWAQILQIQYGSLRLRSKLNVICVWCLFFHSGRLQNKKQKQQSCFKIKCYLRLVFVLSQRKTPKQKTKTAKLFQN